MSPAQAQAALKRMFGKAAAWRYDENALKGEAREALQAEYPSIQQRRDAAKAAMEARRAELLSDPEYLRLCVEYRAAREEADKTLGRIHHRRVTVGHINGLFFTVVAEGDNWQDAIDNAKAKVTP